MPEKTANAGLPPIVDRAAFEAEVAQLRAREKATTHELDAIAATRRRLPMVEVWNKWDLLGEGRAPEHEQAAALAARDGCRRSCRAEVIEDALLECLGAKRRIAAQHEQRMLEIMLERHRQLVAGMHLQVGREERREVRRR